MVFAQSSPKNQSLNKTLFPATNNLMPQNSYFATKTITASGDTNIQIKKKESAKAWHYVLIAAGIAAAVYFAGKRLDT